MKHIKVRYTGEDNAGPIGMVCNPYDEGSTEWNATVDFACMPKFEFTIAEVARYHGIDAEFYTLEMLKTLQRDGIIIVLDWGAYRINNRRAA
jgi:hypothetical protein